MWSEPTNSWCLGNRHPHENSIFQDKIPFDKVARPLAEDHNKIFFLVKIKMESVIFESQVIISKPSPRDHHC
ncbi:unnamed protein product [Brassica rapa subsp. narinosa]